MARVAAVATPPDASAGMVGMLKPRVWPPTPGTQSGIVTEMLLIFDSTQLIAEITPLMGAFARFTIMPKTFPKMATTLSQAADQLPENTLSINPMIFEKIAFTFSQAAEMLCHQPLKYAPSIGNRSEIAEIAAVTALDILAQIALIFAPAPSAHVFTLSQFL